MRIGVGRLDRTLLGCQLGAPCEIVVMIAGAFGEHRREQIDVWTNAMRTCAEPRRKTLRKVPGCGVQRAVETAVVSLEHVAICGCGLCPNIDDVETAPRRNVEVEFERWHRDN